MPLTPDEFRGRLDKLVLESREEGLSDKAIIEQMGEPLDAMMKSLT